MYVRAVAEVRVVKRRVRSVERRSEVFILMSGGERIGSDKEGQVELVVVVVIVMLDHYHCCRKLSRWRLEVEICCVHFAVGTST